MRRTVVLVALILSAVARTSAAAAGVTYYVSAAGDDGATGTDSAHPFRTAAAVTAVGALGPGSAVPFRGGDTFAGPLLLRVSGAADGPCTIRTYGDGPATLTDAAPFDRPVCRLTDAEAVTVEHLRFSGTPGANYPGPDFRAINVSQGLSITATRTAGHRLRSVTVRDCAFSGTQAGLWIDCEAGANVDGYDGVLVTGNTFDAVTQFGCYVIGYHALKAGPADQIRDVVITGNAFRHSRGDPRVASEAQPLGVTSATGITIEGNAFADNCGFGGTPVGGSTALSVSNCRQFRIRDNEVTGTHCCRRFDGRAIDADQDSRDGEISGNVTYRNGGPAVQLGSFGDPRTGDVAVHHNLRVDDVRGCRPDSVQGAVRFWGYTDHTEVFNNTVVIHAAGTIGTPSCVSFEGAGRQPRHFGPEQRAQDDRWPCHGSPQRLPARRVRPDPRRPLVPVRGQLLRPRRRAAADQHRRHPRPLRRRDRRRPVAVARPGGGRPFGWFGDAGLAAPDAFAADRRPPGPVVNFDLTPASRCHGAGVDVRPYLTVHLPLRWVDLHGRLVSPGGTDAGAVRP